jgi:hypothetical protein
MTKELLDIFSLGNEQITSQVVLAFDDEGQPKAWFDIVSKDSDQYRNAAEKLRVVGIKRGAAGKKIDTKTDDGAARLDGIIQRNEFELAVAVVVGWGGFGAAGQPAPLTDEALRKVLTAKPTWREKIIAALEDEASFLPKPSKTSANTLVTNSD